MRKSREQKGITLITLVVTITIMLLLSSIIISSIQNNGVLNQVGDEKNKFAQTESKYKNLLAEQKNLLNNNLYQNATGSITIIEQKDETPPSKPQIIIATGYKEGTVYKSAVQVEIISGSDKESGVKETRYSLDSGHTWFTQDSDREVYDILENGSRTIHAITYDKAGNSSEEESILIFIDIQHTFNEVIIKAATCTESGTTKYTCIHPGCEYSYTEETLALGHNNHEYTYTLASCTEKGKQEWKCSRCEKVVQVMYTSEALGHEIYKSEYQYDGSGRTFFNGIL